MRYEANQNDAIVALGTLIVEHAPGPFLDCVATALGEHANALRDNDDASGDWQYVQAMAEAVRAVGRMRERFTDGTLAPRRIIGQGGQERGE